MLYVRGTPSRLLKKAGLVGTGGQKVSESLYLARQGVQALILTY